MPEFKLVDEAGTWLTDIRLSVPDWKSGDRIRRGSDTVEVLDVQPDGEKTTLVVRSSAQEGAAIRAHGRA